MIDPFTVVHAPSGGRRQAPHFAEAAHEFTMESAAGCRGTTAAACRGVPMLVPFPFTSYAPTLSLFVSRDGAGFTREEGTRADLSTKGPLRRIFAVIVRAHRESPARGLSVREVFEAGWGSEVAHPDAMAGRVYSAMSKLRRLGLGDVLQRSEAGYHLDPRCCVIEESRPQARERVTVLSPVVPARLTRLAS